MIPPLAIAQHRQRLHPLEAQWLIKTVGEPSEHPLTFAELGISVTEHHHMSLYMIGTETNLCWMDEQY